MTGHYNLYLRVSMCVLCIITIALLAECIHMACIASEYSIVVHMSVYPGHQYARVLDCTMINIGSI